MSARTHLHVLTLALLAALMVAPTASPHRLKCATTGSRPSITCLRHEEMHARYTLAWLRKHETRGLSTTQVSTIVRNHRWLYRNAERWIGAFETKRALSGDWLTYAVPYADRIFHGTAGWLTSCSGSEGGHGGWVWNGGAPYSSPSHGSGAGGWMQFMSGTFYGNVVRAFAEARARGLAVPDSAQNWSSPVGQAITAAYMRYHGIDRGQWTGARC